MSDFTCPRCQQPATERFYGPCSACRGELRQIESFPGPDPEHFVARYLDNGRQAVDYVGPRVDDLAKGAA